MCIKRINYEVETFLNFIRDSEIKGEEIEYKLPETMQKYFIQVDDVDKFIGSNPNFIPGNIIKEKIIILTHEGGIFLIRLEYFTEYKTQEEVDKALAEDGVCYEEYMINDYETDLPIKISEYEKSIETLQSLLLEKENNQRKMKMDKKKKKIKKKIKKRKNKTKMKKKIIMSQQIIKKIIMKILIQITMKI